MLFQRVFIRKYHIQSCFWSACCTLSNLVSSFYQKAFVLTNVRNKKEKNSFYRIFLNLWIMRFDAVFSLFLFWHVINTRTKRETAFMGGFLCIYVVWREKNSIIIIGYFSKKSKNQLKVDRRVDKESLKKAVKGFIDVVVCLFYFFTHNMLINIF